MTETTVSKTLSLFEKQEAPTLTDSPFFYLHHPGHHRNPQKTGREKETHIIIEGKCYLTSTI